MPTLPGGLLTATWRDVVIVSYEVDPGALRKRLPRGVSLDLWEGECLASVVGLQFLNTRLMGLPLPVFGSYPEVNLRFYVRREVDGLVRRGVVFLRQLVPHRLTAMAARLVYHERFRPMPVTHSAKTSLGKDGGKDGGDPERVQYRWRGGRAQGRIAAWDLGRPFDAEPGSMEEFVSNRHWGYGTQPDGSTLEYHVSRPVWQVSRAGQSSLETWGEDVLGVALLGGLAGAPVGALYAHGSEARIHRGAKLD